MQNLANLQNRTNPNPLDEEIVHRLLTRYHPNMMRLNLTATNLREGNDAIDPDEIRNKEI
jgi:tRNA uridine 5-carbamoylmethylation protein Kti12